MLKNISWTNLFHVKSIIITGNKIPLINFASLNDPHKKLSIQSKTKSFIGFSSGRFDDFGNAAYIPLPIKLKAGLKVYIRLQNANRIELGAISPLEKYGKFFDFHAEYIKTHPHFYDYQMFFYWEKMPHHLKTKIRNIRFMELFIEGNATNHKLGNLYFDYLDETSLKYEEQKDLNSDWTDSRILKFIPSNGYNQSLVMWGPYHYVSERELPYRFPLYIKYVMNSGRAFKSLIPNWSCKKEKRKVRLNLPNFEPLN